MACRAVHLEVAHSQNKDFFMNVYRRLVGRRGPVWQLRSDQGSNFVGYINELKEALTTMEKDSPARITKGQL